MSASRRIRAKKVVEQVGLPNPFVTAVLRSHGVQRLRLFINDQPVRTFDSKSDFIEHGIGIVGARLESRQEMASMAMNGGSVVVLARRRTYLRR